MRTLAGPDAQIHFTHLSEPICESLGKDLRTPDNAKATVQCHTISVIELMKMYAIPLDRVCLLDPRASKSLCPQDATEFDWFLFGVSLISCKLTIID